MLKILNLLAMMITYVILHELTHYTVARILGFKPRLVLAIDGLLPSFSIYVPNTPELSSLRKYAVLYSPYIINLIYILMGDKVEKLIGLTLFANIVVEDEGCKPRKLAVALILVAIIFLVSVRVVV